MYEVDPVNFESVRSAKQVDFSSGNQTAHFAKENGRNHLDKLQQNSNKSNTQKP